MSQHKIHYAGPWITEAEVAAVAEAARNGFYENYRLHASKLEKKICEYLGVRHCLAVNSGTAAMHLGLASLGIGPGDEVAEVHAEAGCTGATPASTCPVLFARCLARATASR